MKQAPEDIVSSHQSIEWFNGGDNRDVIVVNGDETFCFPKKSTWVKRRESPSTYTMIERI